MDHNSVVYVGVDAAKAKHAIAIAQGSRGAQVRYLGEIDTSPAAIERLVRKLEHKYKALHVCYEAGPTTFSEQTLSRELLAMGYRKLSARPRHHQKSEAAVDAFKKTSPLSWTRSRWTRPTASP